MKYLLRYTCTAAQPLGLCWLNSLGLGAKITSNVGINIALAKRVLLFLTVMCFTQAALGQSVFGSWKTIDDRTGNPKGIINIYEKNGLMYGYVDKILEPGKENHRCTKCEGDLKDKPVVGMEIITAAEKDEDGEWKGDTLFDPEQAMTFRCKIWLNPDNPNELKVRGYLAFIYRTQTWLRVQDN